MKKEKLNLQDDAGSQEKINELFHWTDTVITQTKKQAIEIIPVEYHDFLVRHRLDFEMNSEFLLKLTPKYDEAVYSEDLSLLIYLNKDLIVELALLLKFGILTALPSSKYAS